MVLCLLCAAAVLLLDLSCATIQAPADVRKALKSARDNRGELVRAIRHFSRLEDSLKLRALYFLIENMEDHGFTRAALYDSAKVEIDFAAERYSSYDEAVAALDSLEAAHGTLNFGRKAWIEDIRTVDAEYLIENVELAFRAWQFPWAAHMSFDDFCNYVLPYRGSNEPVERWRGEFLERYRETRSEIGDEDDPVQVAHLINQELKSWFSFDPLYYLHPTDLGLTEMLECGMGRCEDMTNLAIYALRANGVAVTSDYTPHWADTGNNHAWNAVLERDGRVIPFMGCEANPREYSLRHRMAKAYRKTFSRQQDNLAARLTESESAPRWLRGRYYRDVTASYTDVADVTLSLTEPVPEGQRFAYLCVFNSGSWKAIHWAEITGTEATFSDMGLNLAYLPMYYVEDELTPAGQPFILGPEGSLRCLDGDQGLARSAALISTTRVTVEQATEGMEIDFLETGAEYELFFWDGEWVSLGSRRAGGEPLRFDEVPVDRLYWLVQAESRREERIFTLEGDRQIWW